MAKPPIFYVGSARWTQSLTAVVEALRQQLAHPRRELLDLLTQAYGTPRATGSQWRTVLATAQARRCFWCAQPMTARATTLEHVLPYQGDWWPRLARMEQLLSLRLSHPGCNTAYRDWRQAQSAARLARMDDRLVRHIRQTIADQPLLRLYDAGQHHPA
jgi:hypothetical protein